MAEFLGRQAPICVALLFHGDDPTKMNWHYIRRTNSVGFSLAIGLDWTAAYFSLNCIVT